MRRFLLALTAITLLATPSAAEVRQFWRVPMLCTAGPPPTAAHSNEIEYYAFTGDMQGKPYTVCSNSGGSWGTAFRNGESCNTYYISSFTLFCQGGAVSAPAVTPALQAALRMTDLAQLRGDTLYVPTDHVSQVLLGHSPLQALPAGYGMPVGYSPSFATIAWDSARSIPLIPISGTAPARPPTVAAAPPWVSMLRSVFPWAQLVAGIGMILFAIAASAGYARGLGNPDQGKRLRLGILTGGVVLGVLLSAVPAGLPEWSLQRAYAQYDVVRAQVAKLDQDRASLAAIFRNSPISQTAWTRAQTLMRAHVIDPVSDPNPPVQLLAVLCLLPGALFFLFYLPRFVRGCDYLFRQHPAEPVVVPALRKQRPIDASKLADALTPDIRAMELREPAYRHMHDAEKARALKEKLDADAALADAAIERERKRTELEQKRAEVAALERELGRRR